MDDRSSQGLVEPTRRTLKRRIGRCIRVVGILCVATSDVKLVGHFVSVKLWGAVRVCRLLSLSNKALVFTSRAFRWSLLRFDGSNVLPIFAAGDMVFVTEGIDEPSNPPNPL